MSTLDKYKKKNTYSYTYGVYPTLELLHYQPSLIRKVILSPRGKDNKGATELLQTCQKRNISVKYSDGLIQKMAQNENTYAIGVFEKYENSITPGTNHLVLVNPSDMGNVGTIIRSMLGFGLYDLALVRPAVDVFDPKVIRSSMGALFRIRFQYFQSFGEYLNKFDNQIYTFMTNAKHTLPEIKFEAPYALVFGNESQGLGNEYLKIGNSVRIPQNNEVDSLNLSIAVGIAAYEANKKVI